MAEVVGVLFKGGVKVYHFDPAGLELSRGDRVVVQTSSGPEIGTVAEPPHTVEDSELLAPLKKVVRAATDADLEHQAAGEDLRREAMLACRALIAEHGLDMKLVGADVCFGGEKITFSFYSEERIDFRALVADLAKTLKKRIELRQVGAREEARMVGGLGPCGRALCCSTFQGDDTPVSIRMAKEQNLPLNPMKISGLCGRLMCCLKYEQEQYVSFRKEGPPKGTRVITLTGDGVVAGYNLTKEAIAVRLEDGSMTEVRLSSCERQEGGELLVIAEAPPEEFAPMKWLDSHFGIDKLVRAEETPDALPVVEAEIVLNEKGEPVDVIVAESSRRGRRGRGRGRRRGGGQGEGGDAATAGAPAGGAAGAGREAGAGAGAREGRPGGAAGPRGGQGSRGPGPRPGGAGRGGPSRPGSGPGGGAGGEGGRDRPGAPGGAAGGAGGQGGEQSGTSSSARRRRRRPRRPGEGGQGGGQGGAPGAGPAGGGSGGGGASGE